MNTNIIFTANSGHIIDIQLGDPRQANLNVIPGFRVREFRDAEPPEQATPPCNRETIR